MSHLARAQRADHRAHQSDGYGESLFLRIQSVQANQRVDRAGDHDRVETEEQAAKAPESVARSSEGLSLTVVGPSSSKPCYRVQAMAANGDNHAAHTGAGKIARANHTFTKILLR